MIGQTRSLRILQGLSVLLGLSLAIGETIRSWGVDRGFFPVADDWIACGLLILAAWLVAQKDERARRAAAAIWGIVSLGAFYSFIEKVVAPEHIESITMSPVLLTTLVGMATVISIGCMLAAILLPSREAIP